MKKILIFVLILFVFTACGSDGADTETVNINIEATQAAEAREHEKTMLEATQQAEAIQYTREAEARNETVVEVVTATPTNTPLGPTTTTAIPPTFTPSATPIPTATYTPPTNTPPPLPTPDHPFSRYLPQTWEGSWKNHEMVLYVEEVSGNSFQGKLNWPDLRNSITSVRGEFVKEFGDFIEQTKWGYVEGFDSDKSGSWLKFTELELLQGSNILLNGWYYAHIENDGITMKGVYFRSQDASTPDGAFTIMLTK